VAADGSAPDPPTVVVPRPELDTIRKETAEHGQMEGETGGVLLGRRLSNDVVFCLSATRPGPNAEHHHAEFSPDVDYAQAILDDYRREYDAVWIGTWHKHPGRMNRLSDGDIAQMREFVRDPELIDEIVAVVTTYGDGTVKLNPFYMDDSLEWTRTDVEIVDDAEPYLEDLRHDDEASGDGGTPAGEVRSTNDPSANDRSRDRWPAPFAWVVRLFGGLFGRR
jgi:integrative and conjugative element protein (TIGR02256 family)